MCAIESQALTHDRKYPQFDQNEIFQLSNAFQNMDVEDKGYIDEATVIKATQNSERQPYDVVRQALKEVELDSSRRVELDDYVDVYQPPAHVGQDTTNKSAVDLEASHIVTSPTAHGHRAHSFARSQQRPTPGPTAHIRTRLQG